MPGEQGDVDLGDDGVFVADDAGEKFFAPRQAGRGNCRAISCLTVFDFQPLSRNSSKLLGLSPINPALSTAARNAKRIHSLAL